MYTYSCTYTHACMDGGVYLVLRCSNTNRHGNTLFISVKIKLL